MKYPKIETLYTRSTETFGVIVDQLRREEFGLIKTWLVTEKIDGTNIRVILTSQGDVEIRGRTDKAQFNPVVLAALQSLLPAPLVRGVFEESRDEQGFYPEVILYGEGYGEKIQKGGNYRKGQSFRLFDVKIGNWWLNWNSVQDIAGKIGIRTVPTLGFFPFLPRSKTDMFTMFSPEIGMNGKSIVAREDGGNLDYLAEGIVARTEPLLLLRNSERLMWKLKFKDFK